MPGLSCLYGYDIVLQEIANSSFQNYNNNYFVIPDSLAQLKLTYQNNSGYQELNIDNISLYSEFDGQYNLRFLKNALNTSEDYHSQNTTFNHKDSSSFNMFLFSSNYNGMFKLKYFKKIKSLYFILHPTFESSGGYYVPRNSEDNFLDLKFLENSSFQNIGINAAAGFQSEKAKITLNILLNRSKLYIPVKIDDTTNFKQQFTSYNSLLNYLNFENSISSNLKISGNFFMRNFLRDYGATYDSLTTLRKTFNSMLQVDEFNYGGNFNLETTLLNLKLPFNLKFHYSQNIFLFSNAFENSRVRTESERLNICAEQNLEINESFITEFAVRLKNHKIIYSEFGDLPKNMSAFEYLANFKYMFSDSSFINCKIENYPIFPFAANYYQIAPYQLENLDLSPENWYVLDIKYYQSENKNFHFNLSANISFGDNLIYPNYLDTLTYQMKSDASCSALGGSLDLYYNLFGIKFSSLTKVYFIDFSDENLSLVQNFRFPKFSETLSVSFLFNFGLNITLQDNFRTGLASYDYTNHKNITLNNMNILDLYLQQKIYTEQIFLAIRNLTNQYFEYNFRMPESGLNFLLGISLTL
ncbi:MAG: hypothetical protein A2X64_00750 [Ignavibacteria bacterium GWF2_33_9]|nr:MAG: hypothetical protein A2X64_00750 [Ignavibacteria bacterium GWF2_33_9]